MRLRRSRATRSQTDSPGELRTVRVQQPDCVTFQHAECAWGVDAGRREQIVSVCAVEDEEQDKQSGASIQEVLQVRLLKMSCSMMLDLVVACPPSAGGVFAVAQFDHG